MGRGRAKGHFKVYTKSREELEQALRRQLANMRRSFVAFDQGAMEEAERIASAVFIICHQGGQASLLHQLDLRHSLMFFNSDYSEAVPNDVATFGPPLLGFYADADGTSRFTAGHFPGAGPRKRFSKWWKGRVYENTAGLTLSRMNLIHSMRCEDGGGHVDAGRKDPAYDSFVRYGDQRSWNANRTFSIDTIGHQTNHADIHNLTVRQIGCELDETLKEAGY